MKAKVHCCYFHQCLVLTVQAQDVFLVAGCQNSWTVFCHRLHPGRYHHFQNHCCHHLAKTKFKLVWYFFKKLNSSQYLFCRYCRLICLSCRIEEGRIRFNSSIIFLFQNVNGLPGSSQNLTIVGGYNGKSCIPFLSIFGSMLRTKWRTEMAENIMKNTGKGGKQPSYFAWEMSISY